MSTIDIATVQEAVGPGWSAFVTVEEIVHIDPNGNQVIETVPTYAAERIGTDAVTQHSKSLDGLVRSVEAYEARRQAQEDANAEAVAENNARIARKHDARLQQRAAKLSWSDVVEIVKLKVERGDDLDTKDAALAEIAALKEAKSHPDDPVKGA